MARWVKKCVKGAWLLRSAVRWGWGTRYFLGRRCHGPLPRGRRFLRSNRGETEKRPGQVGRGPRDDPESLGFSPCLAAAEVGIDAGSGAAREPGGQRRRARPWRECPALQSNTWTRSFCSWGTSRRERLESKPRSAGEAIPESTWVKLWPGRPAKTPLACQLEMRKVPSGRITRPSSCPLGSLVPGCLP